MSLALASTAGARRAFRITTIGERSAAPDNEDRARRRTNDVMRGRAEHEQIQCSSPVDAHHNQVRATLHGLTEYLSIGPTFDDGDFRGAIRARLFGNQAVQALACPGDRSSRMRGISTSIAVGSSLNACGSSMTCSSVSRASASSAKLMA